MSSLYSVTAGHGQHNMWSVSWGVFSQHWQVGVCVWFCWCKNALVGIHICISFIIFAHWCIFCWCRYLCKLSRFMFSNLAGHNQCFLWIYVATLSRYSCCKMPLSRLSVILCDVGLVVHIVQCFCGYVSADCVAWVSRADVASLSHHMFSIVELERSICKSCMVFEVHLSSWWLLIHSVEMVRLFVCS